MNNKNNINIKFKLGFSILNKYINTLLLNYNKENMSISKINISKINNFYFINLPRERVLFTWKNIIHINNIELLKFVFEVRKFYVDSLKNLIVKYIALSCNKYQTTTYNKYCEISSFGSTALTSNYDVNVSSFLLSTNIVENFNKYFYSFWNDSPSEIFDTNFYGNCFFIIININIYYDRYLDSLYNKLTNNGNNIFYLPPNNQVIFNPDTQNIIFKEQISWLVIKIYLYKNDYNITIFNDILDNIKNIILKYILIKYIKNNNLNYLNYLDNNLKKKYDSLYDEKKKLYNKNSPNKYRQSLDNLYVETLKKIDDNQFIYRQSNNVNKSNQLIDLMESISISNFYGNETYFCIGTIYHVLGYIQKLGNFYMYAEYYIHSMIENFIDIFRYIEYIHNHNHNYNIFILKSSKYIYRIYDAMINFLKKNNKAVISNYYKKMNLFNLIRKSYKQNPTIILENNIIHKLCLNYNIEKRNSNSINIEDIRIILNKIVLDISIVIAI